MTRKRDARNRSHLVPASCLAVFAVVWIALGIAPRYRADWFLENLPTLVFVPVIVGTYRRFRFSDCAYVQMTIFLVLHTIGSHYTYSEVPLGGWVKDLLGQSRNHYDRFVHLSFGFLFLEPVRELSLRGGRGLGPGRELWLGVAGIAALSVSYELLEWATARVVDPAAGTAFLGTQGDPWDAQKDMALACGGALAAGLVALAGAKRTARDRGSP
jgi:putative membrane protein